MADTIEPPNFVPYKGCQGDWIARKHFYSEGKSFGYFQCNYCDKNWMSAHALRNYRQQCKQCDRGFLPAYMWQNTYKRKKNDKKSLQDKGKPHRKDLCEACRLGKCDKAPAKTKYQSYNYQDYDYKYNYYDDD